MRETFVFIHEKKAIWVRFDYDDRVVFKKGSVCARLSFQWFN